MTYALLTGVLAAIAAAIIGGPLVAFLRRRKIGKAISTDGPESHLSKAGTPTMGGLLIVGVARRVRADRGGAEGQRRLAAARRDAGVLRDRLLRRPRHAGRSREARSARPDEHDHEARRLRRASAWRRRGCCTTASTRRCMLVPHHVGAYDIGPVYIVIAVFVIIATTSAVGVTDGLDMLCGGTSAVAFAAFGAIALIQHQTGVATFCFATVGALLGFLYWNAYPARIFMGDSGAIPLGGSLAVVALMTGWWLLIPVIGVVFVIEIAVRCRSRSARTACAASACSAWRPSTTTSRSWAGTRRR